MKYDVIIIGAGISGLYCAKELPKELKVLILCKKQIWECNTFYAQGGISIARDSNDIHLHINDTLDAGSNINNINAIKILSNNSMDIMKSLIQNGFPVDRDINGNILFAREGGHSIPRIIHSNGDGTGRELHKHLVKNMKHTLLENVNVIDLLIEDNKAYGVCISTKKDIVNIYANQIVIASGGLGGLFKYHTNANTISGDIHGMILEHNLELKNMEMLQFHPTTYIESIYDKKLLISEAIRGEGAKIIDENGERFLFAYDNRGELAPRDIVARAIFEYSTKHNKKIYLDLIKFNKDNFKKRFPNAYRELTFYGFNIPNDKIPISPSFHYAMGGISTGLDARVNNMENLYAIGECANNGVHGANRLASNSLLEGMVFGKIAAINILDKLTQTKNKKFHINNEMLNKIDDGKYKNMLRSIMWNKVGIIRTKNNLNIALQEIEQMLLGNIGRLLKLQLLVSRTIIKQAIDRKSSLGAHYITD